MVTQNEKAGTCTQHYLGIIGAAHFSFTMEECFFRSNASRIASPSFNPFRDKSTSVSSGLSPQRVVSWGKLVAAWTIASAPLLPNSFLSRLQSRAWRHVCQTALAHWYPTFRSILLLPCRAHVRDYRLGATRLESARLTCTI